MKKVMNRLLAGILSLAAVFTTLPATVLDGRTGKSRIHGKSDE